MLILAIVWGILLFYFLTPLTTKSATTCDIRNFPSALKQSLVTVTFQKKAVLAFTLVILTLLAVWWSQSQDVIYAELHALKIENQPQYNLGILMYSLFIYALVIVRFAIKLNSDNPI